MASKKSIGLRVSLLFVENNAVIVLSIKLMRIDPEGSIKG